MLKLVGRRFVKIGTKLAKEHTICADAYFMRLGSEKLVIQVTHQFAVYPHLPRIQH